MDRNITTEYRELISGLGFTSNSDRDRNARNLFNQDALQLPENSDRRFRYAAVFKQDKLGITDVFEINGAPCIYFKSLAAEPTNVQIREWHRTAWNHGLGRMLWIVTPTTVRVLNAFRPPAPSNDETETNPAELLTATVDDLEKLRKHELDRISIENGQFWNTRIGKRIKKSDRIDTQLATDLETAAKILQQRKCQSLAAHRLMLRTLFTAYLEARSVLPPELFRGLKADSFSDVLLDPAATEKFFLRMRDTFNGDLFPPPPKADEESDSYKFTEQQLDVARRIVIRQDLTSGQQSFDFWRYDFEVIPIELISSIYERFIYAGDPDLAKDRGTHYTPVNLVDLVYSQVLDDGLFKEPLPDNPKVLDLSCGSGVFLVEAFRRLVARRMAAGEKLNRTLVRDVLANQLYGVDLEETAIEIAAFSLCLTAFELDPSPDSYDQLKFRHSLKGRNLFVGDAFEAGTFANEKVFKEKQFSLVVGNPPWTKPKGQRSKSQQTSRSHIEYCENQDPPIELPFRSPPDQPFLWRACDFAHDDARFGMIIGAKDFFSHEEQSLKAKKQLLMTIQPRVLLNMSALHDKKLFPSAKQPALIYVGTNSAASSNAKVTFASVERSESFVNHGVIELHVEKVHRLSIRKLASEPNLMKAAAYGTPRDFRIVSSLMSGNGSICDFAESQNTELYLGFIRGDKSRDVPADVKKLPMLESVELKRWKLDGLSLPKMPYEKLQWPREFRTYRGPIFVIQQSLHATRFAAAISLESVAYSQSFFGIPMPDIAPWKGKFLATYTNSSLAAYLFMLTSSTFGIERYFAAPNCISRLPIGSPKSENECRFLIEEFDRREKHGDKDDFESLDQAVFDYFEIDDWDREYIADVVAYDLDFVRHGAKSDAAKPADDEHLKRYAASLAETLRADIDGADVTVNCDIVSGLNEVSAVAILFDQPKNRRVGTKSAEQFESSKRLAELLHAPLTTTAKLRRSLHVYDGDTCIIVKHNQRRFWSRARAQDDADSVLAKMFEPVG